MSIGAPNGARSAFRPTWRVALILTGTGHFLEVLTGVVGSVEKDLLLASGISHVPCQRLMYCTVHSHDSARSSAAAKADDKSCIYLI